MVGKWKNKKVAIIMGGISREREISLKTGSAISEALKSRGYDVKDIDMTDGFALAFEIESLRPDVCLIALHGKYGEDGCIQGFLEMLKVPYTGSGVLGSSVGMDKIICTKVAEDLDIRCPERRVVDLEKQDKDEFVKNLDIGFPLIVKPSREGSTINVTIVDKASELSDAIEKAAQSDSMIVVEKYIKGAEVTVGVINGKILPVLEIAPKSGFYDFESKYTKGKTEYIVPARISDEVATKIQAWTEKIYNIIECDGIARADYIIDSNDEAYFLEINTIPGMTELSLVPKAAQNIGISFEDLCEQLLDGAGLKTRV